LKRTRIRRVGRAAIREGRAGLEDLLRQAVRARDKTCQLAAAGMGKCGGSLQVCHVIPKGRCPSLRYELDNVILGCFRHHSPKSPVSLALEPAGLRAMVRGDLPGAMGSDRAAAAHATASRPGGDAAVPAGDDRSVPGMCVLIVVRDNGPVYFDDPDVRVALNEGRDAWKEPNTVAARVIRSWMLRAMVARFSSDRVHRGAELLIAQWHARDRLRQQLKRRALT